MKTTLAIILAMFMSAAIGTATAESTRALDASAKQKQLIDQLLTLSGMERSLQSLPLQVAGGLMQAVRQVEPSESEQQELIKVMERAFAPDIFIERVSGALQNNYNEQRYTNIAQLLSAPLVQRITSLEAQDPNPEEMQAFYTQVSQNPLPSARMKLIQDLDAAMQASALVSKITMISVKASALISGGDCREARARLEKAIAKNRPDIEKANRSSTQFALAFTYREVTDADLKAYLKVTKNKDSQWMMGITSAALVAQLEDSMAQGARALKKIVKAHAPKKTMFAPKCSQSISPDQDGDVSTKGTSVTKASAQRVVRQTRPETDLTACLSLATSAEIIACAEK